MQSRIYAEQAAAFDRLKHAFDAKETVIFGGSGKSFLFEAFPHYVRGHGDIVVACAWTVAMHALASLCFAPKTIFHRT